MLNNSLMYYSLVESSVDGDRLQVFPVAKKLKSFRKNYFFKKNDKSCGNEISGKVSKQIVTKKMLRKLTKLTVFIHHL